MDVADGEPQRHEAHPRALLAVHCTSAPTRRSTRKAKTVAPTKIEAMRRSPETDSQRRQQQRDAEAAAHRQARKPRPSSPISRNSAVAGTSAGAAERQKREGQRHQQAEQRRHAERARMKPPSAGTGMTG